MSRLKINISGLLGNILYMDQFLKKRNKKWTLVLKILGGNRGILSQILKSSRIENLHSVADSRITGLKMVKQINPEIQTMLIKPPAIHAVGRIVKYADISLNTSIRVIKALDLAAKKEGVIHKIIIMIELGELREGVLKENTVNFYSQVFDLQNIEVIGLGTNLGCMYGIEPDREKLMQLSFYKEAIQLKFNRDLPLISGGSSITLPLLVKEGLPESVNHFRIGEAVFMATSPYDNSRFGLLNENVFKFDASIIELKKKPNQPEGNSGNGCIGQVNPDFTNINVEKKKHYRAILDFGILDVNPQVDITPCNESIKFVGTTSDMTVFDIGTRKKKLRVGDIVEFNPNYMGVARLMLSKYVKKEMFFNKRK